MQILRTMLKQKAVWWKKTGTDFSGQPVYDPPIEIQCRWEDVSEQFLDTSGKISVSNSVVYVDRDMKEEDVLWQGELANLTSQSAPFDNPGAYQIRKFSKVPTLKATKFLREATL